MPRLRCRLASRRSRDQKNAGDALAPFGHRPRLRNELRLEYLPLGVPGFRNI
jgi:hypothetical protein